MKYYRFEESKNKNEKNMLLELSQLMSSQKDTYNSYIVLLYVIDMYTLSNESNLLIWYILITLYSNYLNNIYTFVLRVESKGYEYYFE